MSVWKTESVSRHDVVTIPIIWVALALSLLFHGAMMWTWLPKMRALSIADVGRSETTTSLVARLAPRPTPPESSAPARPPPRPLQAQPSPSRRATSSRAPARPPPPLPSVEPNPRALDLPSPPATPSVASAAPAPAPPEGDLSSYIEARRRARGESTPAVSQGSASNTPQAEGDNERATRMATANLASINAPTFGDDAKRGGGIFQIKRMGYDDAEFYFNGWSKDIGRKARQLIEVRKGDNGDIRVAVIRRMIAIIREQEPGDFVWLSHRLGREIVLSARASDSSGLEDFMMREFFTDARQPY
jgi:hypothetical protein